MKSTSDQSDKQKPTDETGEAKQDATSDNQGDLDDQSEQPETTPPNQAGRSAEQGEEAPVEDPVENANPPLKKDDKRGAEDLNALAWFSENDIPGFVDWHTIEHPDFPDQVVDVGGFKPFYQLNPRSDAIEGLVKPHVDFLLELQNVWPALEIRELTAIELAPGLYDVKCTVVNKGFLPTMPEIGRLSREWYPIQVTLNVAEDAKWLEGSRRQRVGRLDGQGGSEELRWLFQLTEPLGDDATLTLETWSPTLHPVEAQVSVEAGKE